ncbi:uncharacterized protein PHACADRAFT_210981 [Phanerochaete carnosa HHB-10118-sp]|uniref:Autophagy-related protein 27 n=1 Tax=Phanerochaete carnosa (strain HHB-10118-sp) TaxID=650164 RepID=K5W306_PHACS|nr:uncharacterized protein PHACADRAFT_210981 [Phanerochaete carnosa HHB-10118-sp]EKM53284.1 hypothetical protein PHACADRAFT_210981 [Phanerochaete carnosa HHB-10118-sp]
MSYTTLAVCLVFFFAGFALAGDTVRLGSLIDQCQFMVDGHSFNLCPLFQEKKVRFTGFTKETPPTITSSWYSISFDGSLPYNTSKSADYQCPPGTWICMTAWNRHKNQSWREGRLLNTIPVAGAMSTDNNPIIKDGEYKPGVEVTARMVPSWVGGSGGRDVLSISLHGGYYVDAPQFAAFHFVCTAEHENSKPEHAHTHDGSHYFAWKTPHACHSRQAVPPPGSPAGEQDLAPPSWSDRSSAGYWTLLLTSAGAVGIIAYLIYAPPRPLRRRVQQYLKAHPALLRFRVGEGVLVRWAHEDVLLEDLDDEATVVHGDDVHFADEEEQIPLKPSPHRARSGYITYGSTTK